MRQLLITALKDTVTQIRHDLRLMPLTRWNESVFRFTYCRAIARQEPDVKQFDECDRMDLVLHRNSERAYVEFKFYIRRAAHDPLSGVRTGMKGGPSRKNWQEFKKCVKTLRQRPAPSEVLKIVVLFYADSVSTGQKTFESYYGARTDIEDRLMIRRLASIGPFQSGDSDSNSICNARLYEILT